MKCIYCKRDRNSPCHNTRDITDFAIDGDEVCYEQIKLKNGGEDGMRYIDLNKERIKKYRADELVRNTD